MLKRLEAGLARTIDTGRIAVYLDDRCFHSKASHMVTPHLGKRFRILELIAADAKLVELFREAILTMQIADEAGLPSDMVLVCTSGIRRGPATGLILSEMMLRDGREMGFSGPRNLSTNTDKWRRKCDSCVGCTDKQGRRALFDKLRVDVWTPLSVSMYDNVD